MLPPEARPCVEDAIKDVFDTAFHVWDFVLDIFAGAV
jgi:hypothetical protein